MRGYKKIKFEQFANVCKFRKDMGKNFCRRNTFICYDDGYYSGCKCCASFCCNRWRKLSVVKQ